MLTTVLRFCVIWGMIIKDVYVSKSKRFIQLLVSMQWHGGNQSEEIQSIFKMQRTQEVQLIFPHDALKHIK